MPDPFLTWLVIAISYTVGYVFGRVRPFRSATHTNHLIRSAERRARGEHRHE